MKPQRSIPQNPLIIVPSRMGSTRLPGKPLADIHGEPMIVHVWRRAMESGIGPVLVACDDERIARAIQDKGGKAILTRKDHPSGSDRIWEALTLSENSATYDAIINVQGDEPAIDPASIRAAYALLQNPAIDIGTLAAVLTDAKKIQSNHIVKAVLDMSPEQNQGRALYFSRLPAPSGDGPLYQHIGLYAYRRDALAAYVVTKPSPLELREKLEQLRALALGMHLEVAITASIPLGVDTPEDLAAVRKALEKKL